MPKVSKFRLGSVEERLLEPVIRLEIMPAEIPPLQDVTRLLDRRRDTVANSGVDDGVEVVRRVEIRDSHPVHRIRERGGLTRVTDLDQKFDTALPRLR